MLTKIHHAAIDGVSGAELAAAIHDLEPDGDADQPPERGSGVTGARPELYRARPAHRR